MHGVLIVGVGGLVNGRETASIAVTKMVTGEGAAEVRGGNGVGRSTSGREAAR
jgi:hypothetical protein